MAQNLPPLAAIRAFEAAARLMSFSKAAAELGMTQSAVSYQIKVLEERVGAPLFLRRPRQVALTDVGQRLAPSATEAFDLLAAAYANARGGGRSTLSISTVQTFAANWLAQRLGSFQIAHPTLAVRLDTSPHFVDFAREDVDLAIRSGRGPWPGLARHFLMPTNFTPMLSPKLAQKIGGVREPADLLRLPIIGPSDPWWIQWLTEAGVSAEGLKNLPDSLMGSQSIEGSVAVSGHGVAMLTPAFFKTELAEGRLVQPFDLVCDNGHGYWLAYPESRRTVPKINAFRAWLLAEVGVSGDSV